MMRLISVAPRTHRQTKAHLLRENSETETMCGRAMTGSITETETANDITCGLCARHAPHPEPAVLSSPEAVTEPRRRTGYSPGRVRHGRITYERHQRRREMKESLR